MQKCVEVRKVEKH